MKTTTPEIRHNVRLIILRTLQAAGSLGLNHNAIHTGLAVSGITDWTPDEVKAELKLLKETGFVSREENKLLGEMNRWTLAEPGRVALAELGL